MKTIKEIMDICRSMQEDTTKEPKDRCAKCKYWKPESGCGFYNRPVDWRIEENNK